MEKALLTIRETEDLTGFRRSKLYALIGQGRFPAPVKIGYASRWRRADLDAWIADPDGWRPAPETAPQTGPQPAHGAPGPSGDVRPAAPGSAS